MALKEMIGHSSILEGGGRAGGAGRWGVTAGQHQVDQWPALLMVSTISKASVSHSDPCHQGIFSCYF